MQLIFVALCANVLSVFRPRIFLRVNSGDGQGVLLCYLSFGKASESSSFLWERGGRSDCAARFIGDGFPPAPPPPHHITRDARFTFRPDSCHLPYSLSLPSVNCRASFIRHLISSRLRQVEFQESISISLSWCFLETGLLWLCLRAVSV